MFDALATGHGFAVVAQQRETAPNSMDGYENEGAMRGDRRDQRRARRGARKEEGKARADKQRELNELRETHMHAKHEIQRTRLADQTTSTLLHAHPIAHANRTQHPVNTTRTCNKLRGVYM